jgi:MFS family permease
MLAALAPLQQMALPEHRRHATRPVAWQAMLAPFRNTKFLRLLVFGCWFSFFNGVTQSAQNLYPMRVLGIALLLSLSLQTTMRIGQSLVSPFCGRVADRYGNRPVMMVCQVLVAAGLLCFPMATREFWGWWAAAWILWIAYAGLNVGLPNLMLKLSPGESNTPYIAAFYAITGLCYATSTILGGWAVDRFCDGTITVLGNRFVLDGFTTLFLLGFVARCIGAILLYWIVESPGARFRRTTP